MINKYFLRNGSMIIFLLLFTQTVYAHPHTFLDMQITVVTSDQGIEGFTVRWKFDYVFSIETIYESDWNEDGLFDAEELESLEYMAFNNLENFHYFTFIYTNGIEFLPKKYTQFQAKIEGETLVYSFFIPHKVSYSDLKTLIIAIYDDTFFCDVAFEKENSICKKGTGKELINLYIDELEEVKIYYDNSVIRSQRKDAIYTGSYVPKALFIKKVKK